MDSYDPSRWLVVGAGAIGGLLGGLVATVPGMEVTLVARGPHLAAMRANDSSITLELPGKAQPLVVPVALSDDLAALPVHSFDVIVIAVKTHQIAPVAHLLEPLCHASTVIIPVQNGIPFWYFYKHGGPFDGYELSTTPKELAAIPLHRIVGSIAFPAAEIAAPGVIRHVEGHSFPLGEPDCSVSRRATQVAAVLTAAGLRSEVRTDFREEVWLKLLGNVCFNPISALGRASVGDIMRFEPSRSLCVRCMRETEAVATALGCTMRVSVEHRMKRAQEKVGEHKTSMLQDLLNGKQLEVEILLSVVELAALVDVDVPAVQTLAACTQLLSQSSSDPTSKL